MASTTASTSSKDSKPKIPTTPPRLSERRLRRDQAVRRVLLLALAGFVVAGAVGLLGARTGSVTASGNGYRLTVQYPEVIRPGLAIRWELRLSHPDGFPGPVRVDTTLGYFDLFDFNTLPTLPASVSNVRYSTVWVFDRPRGE